MLAVAAAAALVASMAAPAAAAVEQNPWAFAVEVTCDGTTFETITTGKVGFMVEGPAGTVGIAEGGTFHLYDAVGSLVLTLEVAPPSGLAGKLAECRSYREHDDGTTTIWDPFYVLFTPNYPAS